MKRLLISTLAIAALFTACKSAGEAPAAPQNDGENAVISTMMSRRSIRAYKDTPIDDATLQLIAECGVNAPNGSNAQLWEVRIVNNPDFINGINAEYVSANPRVKEDPNFKNMFRNAPAIICIGSRDGQPSIDCGLMGENMILAAESLGLGTCCLGGPVGFVKNSSYYEKLGFSEGYELSYMIAIGYPDESPAAKPRDLSKIKFVK